MKNKQAVITAIKAQGMLPLFYHEDVQNSLEIIRTIYKAGVRVLEYTNRGEAALFNFKSIKTALKTEMQDLFLGIGTIKNRIELNYFLDADADFIVCPVVDVEIGKRVHQADKLWIPGCMTPTEINVAYQHQAGIIKLFPANILGHDYLISIKELFPNQLFIPTGGVDIEKQSISNWFKAGVCAVGMGSKMISKEMIIQKNYTQIYDLTKLAFEMIDSVKNKI